MSERSPNDETMARGPDLASADEQDLDALGALAAARFVEEMRAGRARAPGQSYLFPKLGDATLRRQIVRWLGREYSKPTPGILEVLRAALRDDDWEVRVSAMLVATRLRATPLRSLVNGVLLPAAHQFGLSETDVRVLIALRSIATEALDRDAAADRVSAVADRLVGMPRDLVRSALEGDALPTSGIALFVHALVVPNELEDPLPPVLPRGIARSERQLFLGDATEVVWVSPTRHLLGDDTASAIRAWIPEKGFFAARRPITAALIARLGVVVRPLDQALSPSIAERIAMTPDPPVPMSYDDARFICDALARHTGADVALPTADELECAARGTDGRRYPWGNGIDKLTGRERTPHGLERFSVPAPQWTSTVDSDGTPVVLGGPAAPMCATRLAWHEGAVVRPIVRAE